MVKEKNTSLYDKLYEKVMELEDKIYHDDYYDMLKITYRSYVQSKKMFNEFLDEGKDEDASICLDMIKENYIIALEYGIDVEDIKHLLKYYNTKKKVFNYVPISKRNNSKKSECNNPFALEEPPFKSQNKFLDDLIADIDKKIAELDAEEAEMKRLQEEKEKNKS